MDFIVKPLAFVFVFGLLVVFHEFGHYVVARWMGVKVLSFSVGFGPVIWRTFRDPTEYAIRALPLGGFVRMLGDDPTAPMDDDVVGDPQAFHNKPVWRRMLIVAAGPIFNFILPLLVLFAAALVYDSQLLPARVGTPIAGGPAAQAGLLPGDMIAQVDTTEVLSFDDLVREIGKRADQPTVLHIDRDGQRMQVRLTPRTVVHAGAAEVGVVERVGRIQMSPLEQLPIAVPVADGPLWRAGIRAGDRITEVAGQKVQTWRQLTAALARAAGPVQVRWRPLVALGPLDKDKAADALKNAHAREETAGQAVPVAAAAAADWAARWGLGNGDRLIGPLLAKSAEVAAGIRAGDEILAIDGKPVAGIEQLYDALKAPYEAVMLHPAYRTWSPADRVQRLRAAMQPRTLTLRRTWRAGELAAARQMQAFLQAGTAQPADGWQRFLKAAPALADAPFVDWQASYAPPVNVGRDERPDLGVELAGLVDHAPPERIANPRPLAHAWHSMWEQFGRGALLILATTAELFKGNVAVKEVGGVIRMAQLTAQATDHGIERLLQLLAALSINLGILNLLPIPLVDGGQLLFLAIEGVRRRPASLRVRQIAAYVGLTFLGLLFLVVMKNDLQSLFAP